MRLGLAGMRVAEIIRLPDGRRFFFWTGNAETGLLALRDEGFPVGREERYESNW